MSSIMFLYSYVGNIRNWYRFHALIKTFLWLASPWQLPSHDGMGVGGNHSILKEISPEYSLEGLMLKLKLQYFGYLMRRTNSLEKTLMLGKIESRRRRGNRAWDGWMSSPTQWTWVWVGSRSWWWIGRPGLLQSTTEQLNGTEQADEASWPPIRQSSPHTFPEFPMQLSGLCLLSQVGYLVGRRHSILIHLTDRYV